MGGGNVKNSRAQSNQIVADQREQAADLQQKSNASLARGQAYQEPLVQFLQGIIGGNSTTTNQAMAPVLGQIATRNQQAGEQIRTQLPAGAARDYALAGLARDKGAQVAGATNSTFLSAFPQLAQIGGQETNTGLQATGASISSRGNAGTGAANVFAQDVRQQEAKMNAITNLASTAGSVFTGIKTGKSGGGGQSSNGSSPSVAPNAAAWSPIPAGTPSIPSYAPNPYAAPNPQGSTQMGRMLNFAPAPLSGGFR